MISSAWLRWLKASFVDRQSRKNRPAPQRRRLVPQVEGLEDRLTPSAADLKVFISDSTNGAATAIPGTSITYTITFVNNGGPDDAAGTVVTVNLGGLTFTASESGGATGATSGSNTTINQTVDLPSGGYVQYVATEPIASSATGALVLTATATAANGITDTDPSADTTTNSTSATDTVALTPQADLQVTKTDTTGTGKAIPGTPITYTVSVKNAGPSDAPGSTILDAVPATLGNVNISVLESGGATGATGGVTTINQVVALPAGATVTYTVSGTIPSSATGTLTNTATATPAAGVTDTDATHSTATDTVTLTPQADIQLTKADNTGTGKAVPGATITYTVTVTNAGPSDAPGTTITDSLTNLTFTVVQAGGATGAANGTGTINQVVNLPAGSSVVYTVLGTISPSATGTFANTATATPAAGVTDTDATHSTATDTVTLTPQADLQITKSAAATVAAEGTLLYTLTITNAGPSDAQTVSLSDLLPNTETFVAQLQSAGTVTLQVTNSGNQITDTVATLPAGGSATVLVLASVPTKPSAVGTVLANTATVSSSTTDPTPGNNSATANTTVQAPTITVAATFPSAKVGVAFSSTLTISGGTGPYKLQATLPVGLSFTATPAGGVALSGTPQRPGAQTFTISITDANGFTGSQQFTLQVAQGDTAFLLFSVLGSESLNGFLPSFQVLAVDKFLNRLPGVTVKLNLIPVAIFGTSSFSAGSVIQAVTGSNGIATFSHVGASARGRYALQGTVTGLLLTSAIAYFDVGLTGRHSPAV